MQYKQLKRKCFLVHEVWNMLVGEATKGLGIAARQGITLRRRGWRCVRRRFEGVREIGMGMGGGGGTSKSIYIANKRRDNQTSPYT